MKRYLLVLLVVVALVSGCSQRAESPQSLPKGGPVAAGTNSPSSEGGGFRWPKDELVFESQPGKCLRDYNMRYVSREQFKRGIMPALHKLEEWRKRASPPREYKVSRLESLRRSAWELLESPDKHEAWLSGEPTMTAEALLTTAGEIAHHPLNPLTQLPDEQDDVLMQTLWAKYAEGKISARELLYTGIKELDGFKRQLTCQELPEWSSLSTGQKRIKWHQALIQWLQHERYSGRITGREYKLYEKRLIIPQQIPEILDGPTDPVHL